MCSLSRSSQERIHGTALATWVHTLPADGGPRFGQKLLTHGASSLLSDSDTGALGLAGAGVGLVGGGGADWVKDVSLALAATLLVVCIGPASPCKRSGTKAGVCYSHGTGTVDI